MKHNPLSDFLYQIFALFFAFIIVHAAYVTVIRPNADAILEEQRILGRTRRIRRVAGRIGETGREAAWLFLGLPRAGW